jgi:hypothetical protein
MAGAAAVATPYDLGPVGAAAAITTEEEQSSSLIDSKMGRSSGIWGVRVNQKVGE